MLGLLPKPKVGGSSPLGTASITDALSARRDRTSPMKIVIPDDYQDMVDQLACFSLIRHHSVTRYRTPARDLDQLVERLSDADVVVSIRERVTFSRALLERLQKLKLLALV